ncbi:MAG: hypothetical protein LBQ46_07495 [Treponema sp.]|jgi:hypothetical protein|nr:hypothetical protein [Treponema sp.]
MGKMLKKVVPGAATFPREDTPDTAYAYEEFSGIFNHKGAEGARREEKIIAKK